MTSQSRLTVLNTPQANPEDSVTGGEYFFLSLYGASTFNSLDDLRLAAFKRKNAKKSINDVFQLTCLLPTSAVACQHSFRTYCQLQQWLENDINPTACWQILSNGYLLPIPMDLLSAPDKLIHIVLCNCKVGCIHGYDCHQADLPCSLICNCTKLTCNNALELTYFWRTDVRNGGLLTIWP